MRPRFDLDSLEAGIRAGQRAALGRGITLVESRRLEHRQLGAELLERLLPATGAARRIGVTGVPGVGKSTFLESFGMLLVERGLRIGVLAVDPSSAVTGGSILGDKTRMERLASHPQAFVRPSPTGGSLGGVTRKTRETLLLLEAAGFDVLFVETVGVGQSEIAVAEMVDSVLLLLLPGAGDELQGIKRGILEQVDVVAVNKSDGERQALAREARTGYLAALKLFTPRTTDWRTPVLATSGLEGTGLDELWQALEDHRNQLETTGELEGRRRQQRGRWLWSMLEEDLLDGFRRHPQVASRLPQLVTGVEEGKVHPAKAAAELLQRFRT